MRLQVKCSDLSVTTLPCCHSQNLASPIHQQSTLNHQPILNHGWTRMNTDADGLTRISRINANEPMHADFLRGARAPRVQCSAPSRNTRELARRNAFDLTPTSLTSDFVGVFGTASHGTLIILHAV